METITEFDQVRNGFKPAVPDSDEEYVTDLIEEAELELARRRGDLRTWIDAGTSQDIRDDREHRIVVVVRRAVRRVLKNPSGYASETDGDYSYTRSRSAASGEISITSKDWQLLGVSNGIKAGTIRSKLSRTSPRYPDQGRCR
ncbi:hypothetical protein GCM10022234_00180 [Aeromicrobium panaciterrae]|uniref:Gp19/Gp15/Gp42 family protein n=1 Tax=Aeromicrobium panaciterrae TaxID=363861 RepID=UPI0031D08D75